MIDITFGMKKPMEALNKGVWFSQTQSWAFFSGVNILDQDKVGNLMEHYFFMGDKSIHPNYMGVFPINYGPDKADTNVRMLNVAELDGSHVTVKLKGGFIPGGLIPLMPYFDKTFFCPAEVVYNYSDDTSDGIEERYFIGNVYIVATSGFKPIPDMIIP